MNGAVEKINPSQATEPGKWVWMATAAVALGGLLVAVGMECRTSHEAPSAIYTYAPYTRPWHWILWISSASVVAGAFCIFFGIHFRHTGDPDESGLWGTNVRVWKVCLLTPWVILPPIWYCAEYFYVYTPPPFPPQPCITETARSSISRDVCGLAMDYRKERVDEFVQGQENTAKVWLAMVTLLAALYFAGSTGKE